MSKVNMTIVSFVRWEMICSNKLRPATSILWTRTCPYLACPVNWSNTAHLRTMLRLKLISFHLMVIACAARTSMSPWQTKHQQVLVAVTLLILMMSCPQQVNIDHPSLIHVVSRMWHWLISWSSPSLVAAPSVRSSLCKREAHNKSMRWSRYERMLSLSTIRLSRQGLRRTSCSRRTIHSS